MTRRGPSGAAVRLLGALVALVALVASWLTAVAPLAAAQDEPEPAPVVESVRVVAPADEAVTDARPVFVIGFEGVAPEDERRLRFRVTLRAQARDGTDQRFDQRERPSGWAPGGLGEVQFRPPRPLADGPYRWEAEVWDGLRWSSAGPPRQLRIDSVAPAWVDSLRVAFDHERGQVRLSWKPVTLDLAGGPEFVTRYHVYRFELGPHQPMVRPFRIAVVDVPAYVDVLPPTARGILYYRVAAEDEAGNVTGVRRQRPGAAER